MPATAKENHSAEPSVIFKKKQTCAWPDFNRRRLWQFAGIAATALSFLSLGVAQQPREQNFTVLYTFNGNDGADPLAGVIRDRAGNLYGTTELGGGSTACNGGCGTVFKIDHSGKELLLHAFTGGEDGRNPSSGLIMDASGNLYGTTFGGGSAGVGTVFKIDASGNETILHSFDGSDGADPYAGLIMDASGNLYGTTAGGGPGNGGTVFKIDSSGSETLIYSFDTLNPVDGMGPTAGLIMDASGNLYGTTSLGGTTCYGEGCGTVFTIDPSGNETVLHRFTGADGAFPYAGLTIDASGNLYGTTQLGGAELNGGLGLGTAFKIDSSGNETVLHDFTGGADGGEPFSGLTLDASGNLYGTTHLGGSANVGTVFKIDSAGSLTVLHSFDVTDGAGPYGGSLTRDRSGSLYGTTVSGGVAGGSQGYGTVFKIRVPPRQGPPLK